MLILGLLLAGLVVGALAQFILGQRGGIDWTTALIAGIVGSFVGGLLVSLIAGDGIRLRPSGMIGSLVGAIIVTWLAGVWRSRSASR